MNTKRVVALLAGLVAATAFAQNSPPPPRSQPQQAAPRAQQPRAPQQAQQPQGLSAFGWFADLANACWRADRGENRADVQCYSTQYNRYLRGSIKFYQGTNVVGEGDSVFAWDPNANVIVYSQWGSAGVFGLGEIALENNELIFRTRLPDGSVAPTRSVWRRVDADTFEVVRQRRADPNAGWTDEGSVTYKRVAK